MTSIRAVGVDRSVPVDPEPSVFDFRTDRGQQNPTEYDVYIIHMVLLKNLHATPKGCVYCSTLLPTTSLFIS